MMCDDANTACQSRLSRRRQTQIFASPVITATPNDVYTEQITSTACQDRPNTNFRISAYHGYPMGHLHNQLASRRPRAQQLLQKALYTAPATRKPAAGHAGQPATTRAAAPPDGAVYCACHTKGSRGPAAPTRAAASPGGSVYCACHTTAWCN